MMTITFINSIAAAFSFISRQMVNRSYGTLLRFIFHKQSPIAIRICHIAIRSLVVCAVLFYRMEIRLFMFVFVIFRYFSTYIRTHIFTHIRKFCHKYYIKYPDGMYEFDRALYYSSLLIAPTPTDIFDKYDSIML